MTETEVYEEYLKDLPGLTEKREFLRNLDQRDFEMRNRSQDRNLGLFRFKVGYYLLFSLACIFVMHSIILCFILVLYCSWQMVRSFKAFKRSDEIIDLFFSDMAEGYPTKRKVRRKTRK